MGCAASKLVAAEPDASVEHLGKSGDGAAPRPRQARLSLAGGFNQHESVILNQPPAVSGSGAVTTAATGGAGGGPRPLQIRYAWLSQRGYYPGQPDKANQDTVLVQEGVADNPQQHLFAVLDGHGEYGAECAVFAKAKFGATLADDIVLAASPNVALHRSMVATNVDLHKSLIDDDLSGTTACAALLRGDVLHVANVGDSRAVLAQRRPAGEAGAAAGALAAVPLTVDQTPFRDDECARVTKAGARVLTLDQVEGLKDAQVRCWTNEESCDGDPPRLWAPAGTYPGTAFTRSIGDRVAESIGVIADPEVSSHRLTPEHPFLVVATDGVWEFLSSQRVVDMVAACAEPADAARTLVAAAYKAWLQKETRTDDISVVVLYFTWPNPDGEAAA